MTTENEQRIADEKRICRKLVEDLLAKGYAISVYDGEETTVNESEERDEILNAMMTTDDDHLYVHKDGKVYSFVRLVYGNLASEVINDHGERLTPDLDGVTALCDKLSKEGK